MNGPHPAGAAPGTRRRTVAAAALLVAAALVAAWWWRQASAPGATTPGANGRTPTLFTLDRDGLRYEYHAVTGSEALWDLAAPAGRRRNLARERAAELPAFRDALRRKLGVEDLEVLRAPHKELADQLRRLGYL